jgi:hypothetical protein
LNETVEAKCAECGGRAALIQVVSPGVQHPKAGSTALEDVGVYDGVGMQGDGRYIVESITGKCVHAIPAEYVEPMRDAVERKDWPLLFRIDPEFVPSWCPKCEAHYCKKHFVTLPFFDDGFYDYTMGWCPKNHERKVDD